MGAAGIGDGRDLGAGDTGQIGNLPRMVGTHLQDQKILFSRLQQGQGQADVVVQVAPRRPHPARLAENGGDHLLGRGLAVAAGQGDDAAGEALAMGGGQLAEGQAGILDLPLWQIDGQGSLDHEGRGALVTGAGGEVMAIVALARQGHEEAAAQVLAAVDTHATKASVGTQKSATHPGDGLVQGPGQGRRRHAAASRYRAPIRSARACWTWARSLKWTWRSPRS